jgi:asparagine synthase (glutamine-hydrolysing)
MCGIWAFIELIKNSTNYQNLYHDFMNIKNRGPDLSSFQTIKNLTVGFHRLAIMDPTFHANQPYIIEDNQRTIIFVCNGEIYDFKDLIQNHDLKMESNSDCMTIPLLYLKHTKFNPYDSTDISFFAELFKTDIKGEFAFLLFEFDDLQNLKQVIIGRDEIGVRPLYWHKPTIISNGIIFSSEFKGMTKFEDEIQEFEPGNITKINFDDFGLVKNIQNYNFKNVYTTIIKDNFENVMLKNVKNAVINSIKRRLCADKPIAFLLSGGVDSSLVAGISAKLLGQPIRTFCCGMNEGTDLLYARKVAKHIGSNHTEVFFTPEEGLEAIRDVIWTTETWDTTTIRASVGQYLVCKYIGTKTDAKVVMVGEGPDEVCSSYLFNYYAPNGEELHDAAIDYVKNIHMYDGRRADRCISRWGLEGRIALLDPEFIEAYWSIPSNKRHPKYMEIEKWWLRQAFLDSDVIPVDVLWRKKEAFSDGVSGKTKSWFEIIQDHIKTIISENEFETNPLGPTIEAHYYKKVFIEFFGTKRLDIIPDYWQPKWDSSGKLCGYVDPSARTLQIYKKDESEQLLSL